MENEGGRKREREGKWEQGDRAGGELGVILEEERDEHVFCVYSHRVAARNFRPHK